MTHTVGKMTRRMLQSLRGLQYKSVNGDNMGKDNKNHM